LVSRRRAKPATFVNALIDRGAGFLYCFATFVIVVGIFRGETSIARYFSLTKSKYILEETVANLKAENEHLSGEIHRIKESKDYARKILREKYHVTDDGEKIIYYAD
jgi:cell division protein FtsB